MFFNLDDFFECYFALDAYCVWIDVILWKVNEYTHNLGKRVNNYIKNCVNNLLNDDAKKYYFKIIIWNNFIVNSIRQWRNKSWFDVQNAYLILYYDIFTFYHTYQSNKRSVIDKQQKEYDVLWIYILWYILWLASNMSHFHIDSNLVFSFPSFQDRVYN